MKKVTMIVDLQYGSTGKGLLAGYWAEQNEPDVVITCNMPNAGHTYITSNGVKMVHKVLPNGIVSPALQRVMIGPGAVFDLARLEEELGDAIVNGYMSTHKLMVHPDAMVLKDGHRATEAATLSRISSTMQGSAAAMVEKIMRGEDANRAAQVALSLEYNDHWFPSAVATHQEWNQALRDATKILAEGSQGYSLGINSGFYPYCTSRDCTPARFLSDMAIPIGMLDKVIGTARTYPIRVGNTADGHSGGIYPDQREIDFSDIGQEDEFTTVTGRKRRIFTLSLFQLRDAAFHCSPDEIFLNFVNYLPNAEAAEGMCNAIEEATGTPVTYTGHGPTYEDMMHHPLEDTTK